MSKHLLMGFIILMAWVLAATYNILTFDFSAFRWGMLTVQIFGALVIIIFMYIGWTRGA